MKQWSLDARSKGQPRPLPFKRGIKIRKTLARVYGTSRRASGWEGENVARSEGPIRTIRGRRTRASVKEASLVTRCGPAGQTF